MWEISYALSCIHESGIFLQNVILGLEMLPLESLHLQMRIISAATCFRQTPSILTVPIYLADKLLANKFTEIRAKLPKFTEDIHVSKHTVVYSYYVINVIAVVNLHS